MSFFFNSKVKCLSLFLSHFFFNTFILLCDKEKREKRCEGVKTKDVGLPRSGIKTIFCICVRVYAPISQGAWSETVPAELYQTWSHNILNESFLLQHTFMIYIITCAVGYT